MRRVLFVLFAIIAFALFTAAPSLAAPPARFPDSFPQELRKYKFIECDVRELAPGVTYYHYFFDNFMPREMGDVYDVSQIFLKADTPDAVKTLKEARRELSKGGKKEFEKVAKERFKYNAHQIPLFNAGIDTLDPQVKAAALKISDGRLSDVIETEEGFYLLRRNRTIKKFPVSVYFVVVEWDKADVSFKLAECGPQLKTVEEMVKHDRKTIAAVNGAYFRYVPPTPFYPIKIDGKIYDAKPGYDSKTGMMFRNGEFPVLDHLENLDKYDNAILGYHVWKDGVSLQATPERHWHALLSGNTPHTVIGFNPAERRVVLMPCDGRFPSIAPGLNFHGACYFLSLMGCSDCLTVDGGGSCQMLIREGSRLVLKNRPSDNGKFDHNGARRVQSCIYLVRNR